MEFIEPLIKILLINIVLSGDNAVVIAMASRNLREDLKRKAIVWGTLAAVVFRILFTAIIMFLMKLPFIHFIGGVLLLFVAYKLLVSEEDESEVKVGNTLREAIVIIIFADLLMSLDNVLGIVAVSDGNMLIVLVGIILGIPIMLFASHLIVRLMERFPIVIYFGSALLAWTAGEMIIKEDFIQQSFISGTSLEILLLVGIVLITLLIGGYQRKQNLHTIN
ncbi:TerC family protein [Ornithinibacillus scapharcae]|uniref:TerC family protein n=1 Tax=Ornithinibacillus scapharcae TaxID=1147159 RepID=UPI000225BBC3|nr:TerC family protein [Ornithinibacillus scapharcae]